MIEKIRDVKQKEEERLRETLMNFYKQQGEEVKGDDQPINSNFRISNDFMQKKMPDKSGLINMMKEKSNDSDD